MFSEILLCVLQGCTGTDCPLQVKFVPDLQFHFPNKNQNEYCNCSFPQRLNKMCVQPYQSDSIQMQQHCSCHKSTHSFSDINPKQIPSTTKQFPGCLSEM